MRHRLVVADETDGHIIDEQPTASIECLEQVTMIAGDLGSTMQPFPRYNHEVGIGHEQPFKPRHARCVPAFPKASEDLLDSGLIGAAVSRRGG